MLTNKEVYESYIPECCELKSYSQHCEMVGLCWGILSDIEKQVPRDKPSDCGMCDYNITVTNEERKEFWAKQRMWTLLNE